MTVLRPVVIIKEEICHFQQKTESGAVLMKLKQQIFMLVLTLAALAIPIPAAGAYVPTYAVDTTITSEAVSGQRTQVAKGFAIASRVLRGDDTGALNWDQTLTRAEAATMLVRLMGLEERAEAALADPSPFTDVPEWANGYINTAYEEGLAKGVGNGRFDPSGPCQVQDFITMLYRLTHLEEGTDFSWSTALADLVDDTRAIDGYRGSTGWTTDITFGVQASMLENYFQNGGAFTREAACDVLYFMLNMKAGPDDESLGDLLSADYGMSDLLLFNHSVRRTGYALRNIELETDTLTFTNFSGATPTVVSIQDGRLSIEDSHKNEITVTFPTAAQPFGETFSCDRPVSLPMETVTVSMNYNERFLTGYDEDGEPWYGARNHNEKFTVSFQDGVWSLSAGDGDQAFTDYAYLYAYRSEEHFTSLAKAQGNLEITPEIQALAGRLTAGKTTELDKADAICEWVATHIYYDYDTLRGTIDEVFYRQEPGVVLERRRAICDGYSALTCTLMRAAGLECYEESGRGRSAAHGWNVARLDGEWVVIDNTWDSPLTYEKTAGEGYLCRYDDPELVWVWKTPGDIQEPGASRRIDAVYFHMNLDRFYDSHHLLRDPVYANKTVSNVWHVLEK